MKRKIKNTLSTSTRVRYGTGRERESMMKITCQKSIEGKISTVPVRFGTVSGTVHKLESHDFFHMERYRYGTVRVPYR